MAVDQCELDSVYTAGGDGSGCLELWISLWWQWISVSWAMFSLLAGMDRMFGILDQPWVAVNQRELGFGS